MLRFQWERILQMFLKNEFDAEAAKTGNVINCKYATWDG